MNDTVSSLISTLRSNLIKVVLLWSTLLIGVALKPSQTRRTIFFLLSCLLFGSIVFQPSTSNHRDAPMIRYLFGLASANLMAQASDFLFLNEPHLTLRRNGQIKSPSEMDLYSRMNWANDLISNTRGVNWNYEAPALRRSSKSRWGFVIDNILKTICLYLVWDIISYVMRHNPAFHRDNNEPMGAHGFLWQIWNAMGYWTALYCFIRLNHTLSSALIVMVGEGEPKDYPDMTGPLSETTTVRKFWGRTWHQSLRRMVSAHGKHFANVFLGYPKGTLMSAYLQLFVAFLVSGIIHGTADFVAIRNVTSFYRNILFFTLQAAAIAFEDGMIFLGKRMKLERVPKALGYAWVVAWLALSGPIWLETLITGRLLLQVLLPIRVSLLNFLLYRKV